MQQVVAQVNGTASLMMHNGQLVNPLHPIVKQIKEITSKRIKTDDDHAQIAKLEFLGGMYHDAKIGPYLPGNMITAAIREGAKSQRKGLTVQRGLLILETKVKLEYTGPREPETMFAQEIFVDIRNVKNPGGNGRVMRCRPIFHAPWGCEFTLMFDPQLISPDELRGWAENAGKIGGFGDGLRIGMGRFAIAEWVVL